MRVRVFVCGHVIVCPVHMYVCTCSWVQECAYSMCIYACVCVCVHVYTYINSLYVRSCLHVEMWCVHMYVHNLRMVWFAWQLAMQVTTQNDALLMSTNA